MILYAVTTALAGAVILAVGIAVYRGNTKLIHDYHQTRVKEEDLPAYGREFAKGLFLLAAALFLSGLINLIGEKGRAQGVAIAAAIERSVPIHEYAPMKIKMALTGNGNASKEQVAGMLQRLLKIPQDEMGHFMDATDALAAAYCHYLQMGRPESDGPHYRGWKDFVNKNQQKLWMPQKPKSKEE